jgi:RNA polymerase sigma-B factor
VSSHQPAAHAQRALRTRELYAEAYGTADEQRRAELLEQVVLVNRPVAEALARRYRGRGVAEEDLVQVAYEGLVKAVRRFDPTVRDELLTYAVPSIRGALQRHFRDHGWTVRPPRSVQELQWRIGRRSPVLAAELGREPSASELASALETTTAAVESALAAYGLFAPVSLDRPVGGGDGTALAELLPADEEGAQSATEARLVLGPALRDLSDRERRLLHLRFVEERTQAQIGVELGVTQMQVSRLLAGVVKKLRATLA